MGSSRRATWRAFARRGIVSGMAEPGPPISRSTRAPRRRWLRRSAVGVLLAVGAVGVLGKLAGFGCAGPAVAPVAAPSGAASRPAPVDLMAGQWVGAWTSSRSDMGGALRCTIDPPDPSGAYRAHFDAVFAKVFNHRSDVTLKISNRTPGPPRAWEFAGEEDLGLLSGGVYKYAGHTDGHDFVCTYDSAYDGGTFRLTRATETASTLPATRPTGAAPQ